MPNETKQLIFSLTPEMHMAFKMFCVSKGISMKKWLVAAIAGALGNPESSTSVAGHSSKAARRPLSWKAYPPPIISHEGETYEEGVRRTHRGVVFLEDIEPSPSTPPTPPEPVVTSADLDGDE